MAVARNNFALTQAEMQDLGRLQNTATIRWKSIEVGDEGAQKRTNVNSYKGEPNVNSYRGEANVNSERIY